MINSKNKIHQGGGGGGELMLLFLVKVFVLSLLYCSTVTYISITLDMNSTQWLVTLSACHYTTSYQDYSSNHIMDFLILLSEKRTNY